MIEINPDNYLYILDYGQFERIARTELETLLDHNGVEEEDEDEEEGILV